MSKYIHTLDGRPAYFDEQLWYAPNGISLERLLVKDLKTVRKQQKMSEEWRAEQNMPVYNVRVGYLRVKENK